MGGRLWRFPEGLSPSGRQVPTTGRCGDKRVSLASGFVEQSTGLVITTGEDRAAYLPAEDVMAFRELVSHVLHRPSVAGPPLDLAPFEQLAASLAAGPEIAVGAAEADTLSLLSDQVALREKLPLRIRPTCAACGLAAEKLVNPTKPKAGRSGEISDAIISTVDMAVEHPVLAVVRLMGGVGKLRAGAVGDIAVCERCDGVEFDSPAVTFCPSCRALREESILLTCPDCQTAFRPPAQRPAFWMPAGNARARRTLETHRARLEVASGQVENSLYAGQKQFLVAALVADEEPLGLLRCGRPGDPIRAVAVLVTTRQLVWAYELMTSKTTGAAIAWADVVGVREVGARGQQSLEFHQPGGPPLILNRIKGTGVQLSARMIDFSAAGLHRLACELAGVPFEPWRDPTPAPVVPVSPPPMSPAPFPASPPPPPPARPSRVIPPQRVSPPPVQPPRPVAPPPQPPARTAPPPAPPAHKGWYPDPWRQARLRWWDGRRWTEHLQR